jgi:cellobiose phosphorylase
VTVTNPFLFLIAPFRSRFVRAPLSFIGIRFGTQQSDALPDTPWRPQVFSREALIDLAQGIATQHAASCGPLRSKRLIYSYRANRETLRRVYLGLVDAAHKAEPLTAGSEWLLDNYHVVERHAAAIKKYLPWGFYKTLPMVRQGDFKGFPRIYQLALEFIIHTDAALDPQLAAVFLSAYQEKLELSSGELWAFPIMLRFALLENLRRLMREAEKELIARRDAFRLVDEVLGDDSRTGTEITQIMFDPLKRLSERESFLPHGALELLKRLRGRGRKAFMALQFLEETLRERGLDPEDLLRAEDHNQAARQISVGNTLTSLTAIDQMNWRDWFESISLADRVLRKDPSGLYPRSDFPTRDAIRHEIELISKRNKMSDSAIAAVTLQCAERAAKEATGSDDQSLVKKHVGNFLLGDEREKLERALNYKPSLAQLGQRWLSRHALRTYLGSIALVSVLLVGYVVLLSEWAEIGFWEFVCTMLLAVLPVSELASSLVQYLVSRWVTPKPLPKLNSDGAVAPEHKSIVVVHTIFSSAASIQRAIDGLEVRFLANDDPSFTFVLMADLPDARSEEAPGDQQIISVAAEQIEVLNQRHSRNEEKPFALFFRTRMWNPGEGVWMAWERKRGKLEELNRYLLGEEDTSLKLIVGDESRLKGVKYVITLDSDSQLSRDVAKKLIATISHPMNRPIIDPAVNRVVKGYAFIQPRVTISLTSATNSFFSRLFSGQAGLDPYTNVVSEVYQDLFGEGSFWGKGIYDVHAFEHVLRNRVPENSLLSHDLFEGSFARVALASDIELYDDFPSRYMAYSKRLHRWVRGDWQLLPWLGLTVPTRTGREKNHLTWLSRWKMFDNLRRSLLPPASLLALIAGWLFLPGGPLVWTVLVLLVISFPVFTGLASVFALPSVGISIGGFLGDIGRDLWRNFLRAVCAVAFLPHQAGLMLHATGLTLYRVFVSKKHLLEWEPAERSERRTRNETRDFLRLFIPVMCVVFAALGVAAYYDHSSLFFSVPMVLVWLASPTLAARVSRPSEDVVQQVTESNRRYLRTAAFDTWSFFNEYLRDEYNHLMPDNLQIVPSEVVAERTSPTNISLSMLSVVSAYDLGFIPFHHAIIRSSKTLETIERMDKYRGHLYNWYSIRDLAPLSPRYISTVDSGNMLGHFYTMLAILERSSTTPVITHHHRLTAIEKLQAALEANNGLPEPARAEIRALKNTLSSQHHGDSVAWLLTLFAKGSVVRDALEECTEASVTACPALNRAASLLDQMSAAADVVGWLTPLQEIVALGRSIELRHDGEGSPFEQLVTKSFEVFGRLSSSSLTPPNLLAAIEEVHPLIAPARCVVSDSQAQAILEMLASGLEHARDTLVALEQTSAQMSSILTKLVEQMDFSFLYDEGRALFTIGFNAEHARRDASFYDLLASEARLVSFLAVARGEVPQKHWFSLGRSLTSTAGGKALISWSGTMFEYLMPFIVMHDFPTTILGRTARAVVGAQMSYGSRQGVPWGISESAYSGVDFEKTYQYRAFGVPGLGLKRGLSEDLVVSPYSTFLALPFAPTLDIATENLRTLESEGGRGRYGFFEAVDYTRSRRLAAEGKHVVQSFFAHHQGMSLVSINNTLNDRVMCDRFHSQPLVKSAELLLHERFPDRVSTIVPHEPELNAVQREEEEQLESPGLEVVTSPHTQAPRVRVLSNGQYSVVIDSSGGGFSSFDKNIMLTRWREDPTTTSSGSFVYVHDPKKKKTWSAAYQPTKAAPTSYESIFSPGRAEFKRFDDKIFMHTEITVAPEDDVELRRITVTNLGDSERELDVVSYMEPVLVSRRADAAHPAFSKLFVGVEALKDSDAILCSRRPRTEAEREIFFFHRVTLRTSYAPIRFFTSRADFIGRGGSLAEPNVLSAEPVAGRPAESSIDPLVSLGCKVRLEPGMSETLVFVSGAARSRKEACSLIERYQELLHVNRAFELSWSRAQVELRSHAYTASQADLFHRLAGCLLYNEVSVRGDPETLASNRLSQSALWRFGISGDLPVVLLKITDSRQGKTMQEILLAHHFLRERGIEFDLVVLHRNPGTYMQQLAEDLDYLVRSSPAGALLDRPGGVFLRSSSQISDQEAALLETVARVVIDADVGGLAETVKSSAFDQTVEHAAPVVLKRAPGPTLPKPPTILRNTLGGFSPSTGHYLLPSVGSSRPPLPWSNVVANPGFGFIVTESGGGYTWSENSRENRLTSWSNDPVLDPPSEAVFLRRTESGDYWSLTPAPRGDGLQYSVEHGFGSSTFTTTNHGIESRLTLSGSTNEHVKWHAVTLSNLEATEQKLDLYFYCDLVLGVTREDTYRFISTSFDRTAQALCAVNHYNNEFAGRVVAVGTSEPITGFTASRLEFLGRNGDLSRPVVLEKSAAVPFFPAKAKPVKLSGKTGAGFDPCAVLQVSVTLKPKEERTLSFFLAEHRSVDDMRRDAPRHSSAQTQRAEQQRVEEWWSDLLSSISVRTPSESFDVMVNGWLLYQTISCRIMGRSAFYQSGGALGFRDQLQDSLALLPIRPEMARAQILLHAAHQFTEGDVQHWWHPPTGRGVRTRISDDLLWLPYAVSRYIETTGDYTILSETAPFLQGAALNEGQMEAYFVPDLNGPHGSILDHCLRTFHVTSAVGAHGLPLIGAGDWNDGMNEVGRHGRGESIWLAWFQIDVINRFASILETQGNNDRASQLRAHAASLKTAVEEHGWDGAWYRRAYYDDGTPLGSAECDECVIDSLAQSWAVISKAGQATRQAQAMQSVRDRLVDRDASIIKLLTPPFDKTAKNPGYIKGYPPGIRENGGQYTHAAAWVIIAAAQMGRGTEAFELFDLINPTRITQNDAGVARYQAEPYVMCGDVYSEKSLAGRAGWSWYTGSAGWLYQAAVEHIIGLKVSPGSFTVSPCVPASWSEFAISYRHKGRTFKVQVLNEARLESGVASIEVNGVSVPSLSVPFDDSSYGPEVSVTVRMG